MSSPSGNCGVKIAVVVFVRLYHPQTTRKAPACGSAGLKSENRMKTFLVLLVLTASIASAQQRGSSALADADILKNLNQNLPDGALPFRSWNDAKGLVHIIASLAGGIVRKNTNNPSLDIVYLRLPPNQLDPKNGDKLKPYLLNGLSAEDQDYCRIVTQCLAESHPEPVTFTVLSGSGGDGSLECEGSKATRDAAFGKFYLSGKFLVTVSPGQSYKTPLYWVGNFEDRRYANGDKPLLVRVYKTSFREAIDFWLEKAAQAQTKNSPQDRSSPNGMVSVRKIASVEANGQYLRLTDGTYWEVFYSSLDAKWKVGDVITILTQGLSTTLLNKTRDETANAFKAEAR